MIDLDIDYYFVDFVSGSFHQLMPNGGEDAQDDVTRRIIYNMAKFNVELFALTFDRVGSVTFDDESEIIVGPIVSSWLVSAEPPFHFGPYMTARQYYLSHFRRLLASLATYDFCAPSGCLRRYLNLLEIIELVEGCDELDQGPWYLMHNESKGDHMLVSPTGELNGVIDWDEWVKTHQFISMALTNQVVHYL